jgi:hypothetical protein
VLWRTFAPHESPEECARRCKGSLLPKVTRLGLVLRRTMLLFLLDTCPWLIELDGSRSASLPLVSVAALRMTPPDVAHAGNGNLRGLRQSRGGAHTASCVARSNDVLRLGCTKLGVQQGRLAAFRALCATRTTAQQTTPICAIDLAKREMALSWASHLLACGIDPGYRRKGGSLPGARLGQSGWFWRTSYNLTRQFNPCDYPSPPPDIRH